MSFRGRSTPIPRSPFSYMEVETGNQAHQAALELCDDALAEAELILKELKPAAATPTLSASTWTQPSTAPSPPPPATFKSPAIPTSSGSSTTDGNATHTSHSYYDLSFSRHRGKVFYSKDKTLKLIAFDRNGELSAGKGNRCGSKMAPTFEATDKSGKSSDSSKKSNKPLKVEKAHFLKSEEKNYFPPSPAKSRHPSSTGASSTCTSSTVATASRRVKISSKRSVSSMPPTPAQPADLALSSCQEFEKDGIKYQLRVKTTINEKDGCLKDVNINGVTYHF